MKSKEEIFAQVTKNPVEVINELMQESDTIQCYLSTAFKAMEEYAAQFQTPWIKVTPETINELLQDGMDKWYLGSPDGRSCYVDGCYQYYPNSGFVKHGEPYGDDRVKYYSPLILPTPPKD